VFFAFLTAWPVWLVLSSYGLLWFTLCCLSFWVVRFASFGLFWFDLLVVLSLFWLLLLVVVLVFVLFFGSSHVWLIPVYLCCLVVLFRFLLLCCALPCLSLSCLVLSLVLASLGFGRWLVLLFCGLLHFVFVWLSCDVLFYLLLFRYCCCVLLVSGLWCGFCCGFSFDCCLACVLFFFFGLLLVVVFASSCLPWFLLCFCFGVCCGLDVGSLPFYCLVVVLFLVVVCVLLVCVFVVFACGFVLF